MISRLCGKFYIPIDFALCIKVRGYYINSPRSLFPMFVFQNYQNTGYLLKSMSYLIGVIAT